MNDVTESSPAHCPVPGWRKYPFTPDDLKLGLDEPLPVPLIRNHHTWSASLALLVYGWQHYDAWELNVWVYKEWLEDNADHVRHRRGEFSYYELLSMVLDSLIREGWLEERKSPQGRYVLPSDLLFARMRNDIGLKD